MLLSSEAASPIVKPFLKPSASRSPCLAERSQSSRASSISRSGTDRFALNCWAAAQLSQTPSADSWSIDSAPVVGKGDPKVQPLRTSGIQRKLTMVDAFEGARVCTKPDPQAASRLACLTLPCRRYYQNKPSV